MFDHSVDRSTAKATHSLQMRFENDDLISSLPLELLAQIVEYLDPADIVQSQKVFTHRPFDEIIQ